MSNGDVLREIPLRGMRGAVAKAMTLSLQEMAQLTLHRRVDASGIEELRASRPGELSVNDIVLAAVARVLPRFPFVNATLQDGVIREWAAVHLGVAVALEDGLVVPVIRNAAQLSVGEIAGEARRLAERAREGALTAMDVADGTFTVTNLGALGIDGFTPIINPPQVAILGVGRIYGSEITLSLTIDHRALDGAPGARFLAAVSDGLEAPEGVLQPTEVVGP